VRLKEKAPGIGGDVSRDRMRWMTKLCDAWEMENLAALDETIIERLIQEGWERGKKVPTAQAMGLRPTKGRVNRTVPWNEVQLIPTVAAFAFGVITATILLTLRTRRL